MLAGLGGTLAWWALTGEGDLSEARSLVRTRDGARALASRRRRSRGIRRVVPRQRRAIIHADDWDERPRFDDVLMAAGAGAKLFFVPTKHTTPGTIATRKEGVAPPSSRLRQLKG